MSTVNFHFRFSGSHCDVCGRSVDELKPFPTEFPLFHDSEDRKIESNFRSFYFLEKDPETGKLVEGFQVERTYECFDCLTAADPEKLEAMLRVHGWISISQDKLHPMEECPDN